MLCVQERQVWVECPGKLGNNITALSTDPKGRGEPNSCFPWPCNCGLSQNTTVYLIKQGWQQREFAEYYNMTDTSYLGSLILTTACTTGLPNLNMPMNHLEILLALIRFKFSRTSTGWCWCHPSWTTDHTVSSKAVVYFYGEQESHFGMYVERHVWAPSPEMLMRRVYYKVQDSSDSTCSRSFWSSDLMDCGI